MQQQKLPSVSFIIPTLNAEKLLPKCLAAIRSQDYPKEKIEIIISDGGSKDRSLLIAKQFKAKIIKNPEILHEQGKSRAVKYAKGEILFFTDSDNILSHNRWVLDMIQPYLEHPNVQGFLPQTIPASDSNSLDRYLGYLFTDPFTWFVYQKSADPKFFEDIYMPLYKTRAYTLFQFSPKQLPLFGLSQGVGVHRKFERTGIGYSDDILAGMKLIKEGGIIAYVPSAGVYHYHVSGLMNFIRKYRWRIRNNLTGRIAGMGIIHRIHYFPFTKKARIAIFPLYALSIVFPLADSLLLALRYRSFVMLWHMPVTIILALLMFLEYVKIRFSRRIELGSYE